jgi:hypothetical protein
MSNPLQMAIATLLGNPHLSHEQIAKICNCSGATVSRHAKQIRQLIDPQVDVKKITAQYRMQLQEQMPIAMRVATIKAAAEKVDTNPFVALRAIDMADTRDGLLQSESNQQDSQDKRPMFVLPGNANVQVNIYNNDTPQHDSALQDVQTIDIKQDKE